jgi:hypothetical protein
MMSQDPFVREKFTGECSANLELGWGDGEKMKQICWADVEHTETPGSYPFLDGTVEIKERHIEIWKSNPAALFQVMPLQGLDDVPRYALGSWE